MTEDISAEHRERSAVAQARIIAAALAAGVLVLAAISGVVRLPPSLFSLATPAGLCGLVSLVIGYRLYAWLRERVPSGASHRQRCAAFVRATIVALAVTESTALFGVIVFWLSGEPIALIGVATHIILAGALWPGPERLRAFVEPPPGSPAPS
jgi:hypothetical protein